MVEWLEQARLYRVKMHERDLRIVEASKAFVNLANATLPDVADAYEGHWTASRERLCAMLEAAAEYAFKNGISDGSLLFFAGQRSESAYQRLSCICTHPSEGSMRICLVCSKRTDPVREGI